jgi:hypothetical protein
MCQEDTMSRRRLALLVLTAFACATASVPATAAAETWGDIVINEFRTHGPDGVSDEYIELKNTTNSPINLHPTTLCDTACQNAGYTRRMWVVEYWVPDSDPQYSPGYWEYFYFDENRTIPARGRLLLVNKESDGDGYSLDAYRPGDLVYDPQSVGLDNIPTTHGITLWSDVMRDANWNLDWDSSSLDVDEVGFNANGDPLGDGVEGNPLQSHGTDTSTQYAYVRNAEDGIVEDTDDNKADYSLVGLNGNMLAGGVKTILGAPGPQGLNDPLENFGVGFFRIDTTKAVDEPPNRIYDPTPDAANNAARGYIYLNRTIRNNTTATVNTLKIRFIDITTHGNSTSTDKSLLRAINAPLTATVATAAGNRTVNGFQLQNPPGPPTTISGGGLNSSMTVALPAGGLPPCSTSPATCTRHVQLKFAVERKGTYRLAWWPEIK